MDDFSWGDLFKGIEAVGTSTAQIIAATKTGTYTPAAPVSPPSTGLVLTGTMVAVGIGLAIVVALIFRG